MPTPTTEQLKRVTADWSRYAQEPVEVRYIDGTLYAFGSELACLRIHYQMKSGRVDHSPNLKTWFYAKDI